MTFGRQQTQSRLLKKATLLVGMMLCFLASTPGAQQTPKHVLVLYWYDKDYSWNVSFDQTFQDALRSAGTPTEYYAEYLESNRFPEARQRELLHSYLRQKYGDLKLDALVANSDASLDFLLKYRRDLFPNTPIVFVATRHPSTEQLAA